MEVRLLDTFPHYGGLGPSEIIAMGGFGTVSTTDFLEMYSSVSKDEAERMVKDALYQAVIRGYASMTTSAMGLFVIKGSRILDLYITAFPFGSYMVLSQRYVPVERPEVPSWVGREVKDLVREEIRVYREIIDLGVRREEARGVLGLGTPTHMLAVLPLESVVNLIRWGGDHPEIEELLRRLEEEIERSDLNTLFRAALNAPAMGGAFPHPFHRREVAAPDGLSLISYDWNGRFDGVNGYEDVLSEIRKRPPRNWKEMVENSRTLSRISFENHNEIWVTLGARVPLTTFNEIKRHRTIPMDVEGIYRAMENPDFYVYPSIKNNEEASRLYRWVIDEFLHLEGSEYERVYAIPQSLKIGVLLRLSFAHLTAPSLFYRIRSCDRAEVSMKQLARKIPYLIRGIPEYGERLFNILTSEMSGSRVPLPKCVIGACPEPEFCPLIRGMIPHYDGERHRKIKESRKGLWGCDDENKGKGLSREQGRKGGEGRNLEGVGEGTPSRGKGQ